MSGISRTENGYLIQNVFSVVKGIYLKTVCCRSPKNISSTSVSYSARNLFKVGKDKILL
jgi:hypothetical protein